VAADNILFDGYCGGERNADVDDHGHDREIGCVTQRLPPQRVVPQAGVVLESNPCLGLGHDLPVVETHAQPKDDRPEQEQHEKDHVG
jgi:hypothetical protein